MSASFDVAIVGAGPAGAWAAYRLARAGARVVLIDGSHPREKPCGGGISARARALLSDDPSGLPLPGVAVRTASFSARSRSAAVPLACDGTGMPALVIASRREFDSALLEASIRAGANHVARRVVSFDRRKGSWAIETDTCRLSAAWLIGADGANSLVRRRIVAPFPREQLSVASGHFVHGRTGNDIDIEFTETPPGYLWSFPRPDHLAVGICGQADGTTSSQLLHASAAWICARYGAAGRLARYSWPIPSLTERALAAERPAGERWLLIGDAAGLVDPITREGIFFALRSAELAAESLGRPNAAEAYARTVHSTLYRELKKAARMKARFFSPAFSGLLVQSLQRSQRIGAILGDLVSGRQTYDGLRRRLLFTGEWRLAIEYLRLTTPSTGQRRQRRQRNDGNSPR
jgi:geranylgeranyl reductase family protein